MNIYPHICCGNTHCSVPGGNWTMVKQDKKEGNAHTRTKGNNSVTLPSPLRSSAESRRACRKHDSREEGEEGV